MERPIQVSNLVKLAPSGEASRGEEVLTGLIAPVNVGHDRLDRQVVVDLAIDQVQKAPADSLPLSCPPDVNRDLGGKTVGRVGVEGLQPAPGQALVPVKYTVQIEK